MQLLATFDLCWYLLCPFTARYAGTMNSFTYQRQPTTTSADLCPDLTSKQRQEARDNLQAYVVLVWRICQRLERELQQPEIS